MPLMISGSAAISTGSALRMPSASPMISCNAASSIIGKLLISPCTIVMIACTAVGIKVGSADAIPVTNDTTICTAASMSRGRFSISVLTMVITACSTAGINSGSKVSIVVNTSENSSVTVSRSVGSNSPMASSMALIAVGSASTMFSMTGTMFSTTASNASTRFCVRFCMSASALPRPAVNELSAASNSPSDPEMVCVDSRAKLPAYCSVFSKKYFIATSAFSALDISFHAVS